MDDKQLERRLRAALKDQARHIEVSGDDLETLAHGVVQRLSGKVEHVTALPVTLGQRLRRFWEGETFISWNALAGFGMVLMTVLIVALQLPGGQSHVPTPTLPHGSELATEFTPSDPQHALTPDPPVTRVLVMERIELPIRSGQGM